MTVASPTALAATRACVIALLAVPAALRALRWLRGVSPAAARSAFTATALVFFTPAMLAGYGWLPAVARWPGGSVAREIFYCAMLWVRLTPVAVLALWFANPGPGATAAHCIRLAGGGGWRWLTRELGSAPWLAAAVVFLFAFQEFDLATSWGIRSWTVVLFDAQAGGLALGESLRFALPALGVELVVITLLLLGIRVLRPRSAKQERRIPRGSLAALLPYSAAPVLFVILPACLVLRLGFDGFAAWIENITLAREMMNSLVLAVVCALLAWLLASLAERRMALLLAAPGMLGTLMLSLLIAAAAQHAGSIGRTAGPLIVALVLQLLPLAFLLRALLAVGTDHTALHIARNAGARSAEWTLAHGPAAGAVLLLFGVAYSDFTASALLAPPQFTTVFVRIFNLMHYGQGAVLSAAVFIAVATPLLCLWLTRHLLRLYVARRVR
jgi:hypothetical protein